MLQEINSASGCYKSILPAEATTTEKVFLNCHIILLGCDIFLSMIICLYYDLFSKTNPRLTNTTTGLMEMTRLVLRLSAQSLIFLFLDHLCTICTLLYNFSLCFTQHRMASVSIDCFLCHKSWHLKITFTQCINTLETYHLP